MAARNTSPEFDHDDVSPVAAEGNNMSIDENTIFNTPDPVAASTVGRTGKKMDSRFLQGSGVQGSFIDDNSAVFTPETTGEMNMLKMSLGSLKLIPSDPALSERVRNDSPKDFLAQPEVEGSRSSLGIIPVENMDDLSSSMLHFDPSSPQKGARQKSAMIDTISEDTEPDTPKMAQLSSADSSLHHGSQTGREAEGMLDAAESDMECLLRKQAAQPIRNLFSTGGTASSQEIAAAFAHLDDGGQMDTSLHEVHIDDEELMKFDEEFSDISDLEATVTGSEELPVKGNDDQPEEDRHDVLGSVFERDSAPPDLQNLDEMYQTMASYDEIDMPMEGSLVVDNGMLSVEQFNANDRRLGGEGVESEENADRNWIPSDHLDSRYLRQSPSVEDFHLPGDGSHGNQHHSGDGEGEDDSVESERHQRNSGQQGSRGSDIFAGSESSPREGPQGGRARGSGLDSRSVSLNSSEMDTDDEVEAVRREMRQRFLQCDSADSDRPGLEGLSAEDPAVRPRAEGDVGPSPVPGDGGGGGDGSSGHGSDDDSPSPAPQLMVQQGPTTFEVLRGLGFLGVGSSGRAQVEDFPEADQRMCPMGEELEGAASSSSGSERRVRFADIPHAIHDRNVSGASLDGMDPSNSNNVVPAVADASGAEGRVSMSQFLAPSVPSQMSMTADNTQTWGLEHSTFNIGDPEAVPVLTRQSGPPGRPSLYDESLFPDTVQDFSAAQMEDGRLSEQHPDGDLFSPIVPGKNFLSEDSPVYINHEGEGVTDLAYHAPLTNPFDGDSQQLLEGSEGFGSQEFQELGVEAGLADAEFFSSDNAKDMLAKDEEEFNNEHIFIQEEVMEGGSASQSTLDLPDSWSLHSHLTLSNRPSWMTNTAGSTDREIAATRISIGTFMAGRTEALGSLGDEEVVRPNFGSSIVTPPERKPVAMIRQSPSSPGPAKSSPLAPRLSDVTEKKESNTTSENVNTTVCTASDEVRGSGMGSRGSGVGSDVDQEGTKSSNEPFPVSTPVQSLSSEPHGHFQSNSNKIKTNGPYYHQPSSSDEAGSEKDVIGQGRAGEPFRLPARANREKLNFEDSSDDDSGRGTHSEPAPWKKYHQGQRDSHNDGVSPASPTPQSCDSTLTQSGVLQISSITKLISTASASANPEELAQLIMKMSQSKKSSKRSKSEGAFNNSVRRGVVNSNLDEVPTSNTQQTRKSTSALSRQASEGKESTASARSRQSAESISNRRPADGKSVRKSVNQSRLSQGSNTGRLSTDSRSSNRQSRVSTTGSKPPQSVSQSVSEASLTPTLPDRSSQRPVGTERANRSRIPSREGVPDHDTARKSRIPSLERGKGSGTKGRDGSAGRMRGSQRDSSAGRTAQTNTRQSRTSHREVDGHTKIPKYNQRKPSIEEAVPVSRPTGKPHESVRPKESPGHSERESSDTFPPQSPQNNDSVFVPVTRESNGSDGRLSGDRSKDRQSEDSPGWKSPRPSSVLTRSQRLDTTLVPHFPSSLDINEKQYSAPATPLVGDDKPKLGNSPSEEEKQLNVNHRYSDVSPDLHNSLKSIADQPQTPADRPISIKHPPNTARSRMSSTPKAPIPLFKMGDSQGSISRIDPSPNDRTVPDSADATLWSEKGPGSDEIMKMHLKGHRYFDVQQSTPKIEQRNVPYFNSQQAAGGAGRVHRPLSPAPSGKEHQTPTGPPLSTAGQFKFPPFSDVPSSSQPMSLPASNRGKPTLLTSQPLSMTPFAQQYLTATRTSLPSSHLQNIPSTSPRSLDGNAPRTTSTSPSVGTLKEQISSEALLPARLSGDNYPSSVRRGSQTSNTGSYHSRPDTPGGSNNNNNIQGVAAISVPHEVRMDDVCCLGLSAQGSLAITNTTTRWLDVRLSVVSLMVNGEPQRPQHVYAFIMKEKVIIDPGNTEDIKVIFNPRQAGVYVAQLHLVTGPVVTEQPLPADQVPTMVTLQGIAEQPQVQIMTNANQHLMDFGALPWGCQKGLPITLVNRGRANIPVRLVISANKASWSCFTFEKDIINLSDYSSRSYPSMPALTPNIVNITLPGISDSGDISPTQIVVYFKAPNRQTGRAMMSCAEEFSGRVEVEVDTPSLLISLGTIHLCAAVGTARLHAPKNTELIQLSSSLGQLASRTIPLRNVGTIPLEVSLEVTHWPDFFTVIPSHLMIKPGGQSEVAVNFQPKQSPASKFQSLLLMRVEPDGPGYEMELRGEINAGSLPPSVPRGKHDHPLLSNKHHLAWGGVAIGRARQQTLTLKNNSDQILKLRLSIHGTSKDFMLQSSFGGKEHQANSREILVKPLEEYPIRVLFTPTRVCGSEARLQIKATLNTAKYTIPLTAYGGLGKLILEDLNIGQRNSYWTSIGSPEVGSTVVQKVTLKNTGSRAAFVKAICFEDLGCKRRLADSRVTIQPSEFCVEDHSKQQLAVVMRTSEKDKVLCQDRRAIVAVVAFFYGDEVSRQRYKKAVRQHGGRPAITLSHNNPVKGIDFTLPFEDEGLIKEGHDIPSSPNDVELFFSMMSKLTLTLVGLPGEDPLSAPRMVVPPSSMSCTLKPQKQGIASWEVVNGDMNGNGMHRVTTPITNNRSPQHTGLSPPVKESAQNLGSRSSRSPLNNLNKTASNVAAATGPLDVTLTPDMEWWTIRPDQVILLAPEKNSDPMLKRIQVTNFSDHSISYELSWPAHCVTVTPEQGTIQPRSNTIICISANSTLHRKGVQLPWCGNVHISCDGEVKVLRVQIRNDYLMDDTIQVDEDHTPAPLLSQPGTPLVSIRTPVSKPTKGCLRVAQQNIRFPATTLGKTAEHPLELTNVSPFPIRWMISSFAPPYLKGADESGSVYRANYSVFWFPRQSGVLQPEEIKQVAICFCPRESGQFSQYWEVKSETMGSKVLPASHSYKVEVSGQGIQDTAGHTSPSTLHHSHTAKLGQESWSSSRDGLLYAKPKKLEFSACDPHQTQVCKLELKNKDSRAHTIDLVAPLSPFHVKHRRVTLKTRHYLRLPVEFIPKEPGHYEGILVLKTDTQQTLKVPLIGDCV